MDMVNDDKDIRLDTAEEVKKALLSGADLYNTETGEFWWLYNATDSIATATIHLDDPNLLAVVDNPDFDLYEDIVGGLNYTGYITDSIETIIEDGEENAPLIDPRDEVFAQIASEKGWVEQQFPRPPRRDGQRDDCRCGGWHRAERRRRRFPRGLRR